MADTKVRRISKKEDDKITKKSTKASKKIAKKDTKKVVKIAKVKPDKKKNQKKERKMPKWLLVITAPFRAIGRYVAGSVSELKQTHWPNRKTTWKLVFAVLVFAGFFITLILLLDYGFDKLVELILSI